MQFQIFIELWIHHAIELLQRGGKLCPKLDDYVEKA